ncbi:multicopper oxidase-domain-containing protein [Cladorrhinum sp. PSN259]|nr:multicopper oxidase-domain-containing protein [Cladorrhinum sp. PSN259]
MTLIERVWTVVTTFLGYASLSPRPTAVSVADQIPLGIPHGGPKHERPGPIFKPPGGIPDGDGSKFFCDYRNMVGWEACSSSDNRQCWLKDTHSEDIFDIHTNYEGVKLDGGPLMPTGILRQYKLIVTDQAINADGMDFPEGKVFKNSPSDTGFNDINYPGPWIQACWGDIIEVTVVNNLTHNGTSIHWHGLRQWLTMHMDGVNGVTQCPIRPRDVFVYRFNATQYGSSWYHSHHSIQYADGLAGPITIHGPSSESYDIAPDMPLLMTDWLHNSAFNAITTKIFKNTTILLNGIGNITNWSGGSSDATVDVANIRTPYTLNFERKPDKPLRYLLRVINTSFSTTFVFSIDNHKLQVVGADFVPIHSYTTSNILVGIGQRYHVIVTADPQRDGNNPLPTDGNFWIRTTIPEECTGFDPPSGQHDVAYEQTGIVRYDPLSTAFPNSNRWSDLDTTCTDEPYDKLHPIVEWNVEKPTSEELENTTVVFKGKGGPDAFSLAHFAIESAQYPDWTPFQVNYSDPMFLHLDQTGGWKKSFVVIEEDKGPEDWVYFVISDDGQISPHPIHLHGHDFAILQQSFAPLTKDTTFNLTTRNPPRRDVVLLPQGGFVVIAFKTDNPGNWLLHCHIARHASEGLGFQILERREAAVKIWPSLNQSAALTEAKRVCDNWADWEANCNNWAVGCHDPPQPFQDDSGV